jgi:hypothetical protein
VAFILQHCRSLCPLSTHCRLYAGPLRGRKRPRCFHRGLLFFRRDAAS